MGVLPSKRSPPDGLLRRPVRRNRAACRQPNGGRVLLLAEPAPPCRTQTAAGIASRLTTSTAFAAAALAGAESGRLRSQTAIQAVWNASPHGYTPPNRRRIPKRTAPRFGARFFLSKPARRAKRGRGLYSRACAPFCLLFAATASPRFPARQRGKPISPGQPFANASGGPPSLSRFASPAALAGSGTRRPRAP